MIYHHGMGLQPQYRLPTTTKNFTVLNAAVDAVPSDKAFVVSSITKALKAYLQWMTNTDPNKI